ncbi:DNA/RNA helicase, superfamily II [Mesorhizobium plurifarium]|uniref:DNA/RNA helicase, superfamily II n=1 Tax=Mesorhizobium plurifarium TaxID=69974 RepID=A0A090EFV7_MESPL|nr:DNA/RNA helicase, superfamily II [Mesorhizobium plurifarium]
MTAAYGRLELQGNRWILSDLPPHVAIRLKDVFRKIPKHQTKVFDLPFTDEMSADLSWFMNRYPLAMEEKDRALLEGKRSLFEQARARAEEIMLPTFKSTTQLFGFRSGYDLYDMQKQARDLLHAVKRLLLGDDVGLGKTVTALGSLMGTPYLPAAIVVPAHLADQWVKKFIAKLTFMGAHIIDGTRPYDLPPANLYIFRYTNIHGWTDIAATGLFKAVVFDEIQDLRTGAHTRKGAAAKVFSDNAELRLGLSATPIFGYGSEIWNIMLYIDPDVLGSWEEFTCEWCSIQRGKWVVNDPDALGSYLREARVFLRRLRQGRPINRIPIEVDFDEEVAADAEQLARALAMKVVSGSFVEAGQAARELDAFARLQTGLAKAKGVAALVKMLMDSGLKVILGGWHREVYSVWLEEFKAYKPMLYTGSENAKQKEKAERAFVDGDCNPLIISVRSGTGLDGLQNVCWTVVAGELDWAPEVLEQLYGRVDRPGQTQPEITAYIPYVLYGSDPTIMAVNAIKKDQARGIKDPGSAPAKAHTDESRIKQLAMQFLEKVP